MKQTRRKMIKTVVSTLAGSALTGVNQANGIPSDRNKGYANKSKDHNNMVTSNNTPDMYLAPPAFSVSTFLMHIPQLAQGTPVIMDRHDWERLRGRIAQKTRGEMEIPYSSHSQRLGLIYNQFYNHGLIKLIDYQKYYPKGIQRKNIEKTRALLSSVPDHKNRQAAVGAANGYQEYGFGEYQESLRESLDNLDTYESCQHLSNKQTQKLTRGTKDPEQWNERVLNQYLVAFEVRRKLENELNCEIHCIAQGEASHIGSLLNGVPSSSLPHTLQYEDKGFTDGVFEFDIEDTTKQREVADKISKIAQETVGFDNDRYFVYGPRLAMVESGDMYSRARGHIRVNSANSIANEAHELWSHLEQSRKANKSAEFLNYEAESVLEDDTAGTMKKRRILKQLKAEAKLSNFARDMDEIAEGYSPASKIVVESILIDPLYQYNENDIFRKTIDLMRMLEPVSLSEDVLETWMDRGNYRVGLDQNRDWFQYENREQITA